MSQEWLAFVRQFLSIGLWAPSDLGGGDLLARKKDTTPKCVGVEIRIQMHSNCMGKKSLIITIIITIIGFI